MPARIFPSKKDTSAWNVQSQAWNNQNSACNIQSSGCNIQSSTCNIVSSTCNIQSSGCIIQSSGCNISSWGCNIVSSSCNIQSLGCHFSGQFSSRWWKVCKLTTFVSFVIAWVASVQILCGFVVKWTYTPTNWVFPNARPFTLREVSLAPLRDNGLPQSIVVDFSTGFGILVVLSFPTLGFLRSPP